MIARPVVSVASKEKAAKRKIREFTKDEELWMALYYDVTKKEFLKNNGRSKIKELRLVCFQVILDFFGISSALEQKSQGFVKHVFRDFENAIFNTSKDHMRHILKRTTYFTIHLWKMALEIGDFIMQHRVFLMTSYFMHLSTIETAVKETIELDKEFGGEFGGVFADHLLVNLPTTSKVDEHFALSRKFLNILNISRGINAKVISIEAVELLYHKMRFYPSKLQGNIWIDFNFHERYASVWCLIGDVNGKVVASEVNMIFQVKNIILGLYSSIMIIEAVAPIRARIFNEARETLTFEDIFTFRLTGDGFRLAKMYSDKLNHIKQAQ